MVEGERLLNKNGGGDVVFYDPFTSNSGNWTIPAEVQSASSYSNDGWKINNNLNTRSIIILNNVIISSKNIEIEYIYMGMYTVNGLSMTIDIKKNGDSTSSVGYNPSSQQFQLYINNGHNRQNIPYSLQIGDKVTIVYDNGVLSVKVNDTTIGTYSEIVPDIMGSKVGTWVDNGNWFQIKDFTIRQKKINNMTTIFIDSLTSNDEKWTIPQETLSESTYSENGWRVASTSDGQYITINNVTIPSSDFELEYKYMGGNTAKIRVPTVDFIKNGNVILGVGYQPQDKIFEVYSDYFNQQTFSVTLQENDIVKIIYNNGTLRIEVNNNTIGTYNKEMDIVGTTVNFYAKKDRWYILKDLIIRAEI